MQPFKYHVFACEQKKPEGAPACSARGGSQVIDALRREVAACGLNDAVQVTACGSLGLCENGPNMVVYPEGTWYSHVTIEDVSEIVRSHFQQGTPVERLMRRDEAEVRSEIQGNRTKMVATIRAREASGVLPDDLNDMIRGFMESRAVLTALELDVFTALGDGATAGELAARIGAEARSTEMLLHALASLKLLIKQNGVFRNAPAAARYFTAGSADNARPALLHTANLWPRWSTLTDCVRAGTAVAREAADRRAPGSTEAFIAAMHRNAQERAPLVVRTVGAGNVARMLDVGGGSGAHSIAFAQAEPGLQADILDLQPVTSIAHRHIEAAGLSGRVKLRAGDLTRDDLGAGYDLVFISAICHMLSPEQNLDLFRRSHAALAAGGRVVVQDFILESDKTAPRFAALFALNMLVGTEGGSSYSGDEYLQWLEEAGFSEVKHLRLPGPTGLIVGTK